MSYCFSNIYFSSSALSKVVSTLLSSGINRALCETGTQSELESAALFLPGCLGSRTDPSLLSSSSSSWLSSCPGSSEPSGRKWESHRWGGAAWPGSGHQHRAESGQVQTQISQGTDNSFVQAVRVQRNLTGHLVQPPLFVGDQVEGQRAEVKWLARSRSPVKLAGRPPGLQSLPLLLLLRVL